MIRTSRALYQAMDLVTAAQRLGPAARSELSALRKTHEELKRQLESTPKEADPIDWAHYSQVIRTPGVVDMFKNGYTSVKYPNLDVNASLKQIADAEAQMIQQAEAATKEAEQHLATLQQQLKALETAKSIDEVTMREVLKENPGWEKEIEKEFNDHKWL